MPIPNWRTDETTGLVWLEPDWPAPVSVRAASTTRLGGCSEGAYASLNLATHVGDDPVRVEQNRARLRRVLALPSQPLWLEQVHGCEVACLNAPVPPSGRRGGARGDDPPVLRADASWTDRPGQVCAVMTADCLPLLLCDRTGREVAAVHAGWRGLCDGVIEAALARFSSPPDGLLAWLGPAIGPAAFEVGDEVRTAFLQRDVAAEQAFQPGACGKWFADLFLLARLRLDRLGVTAISGGGLCTATDARRFFSYRRDGVTGRMATLIWLAPTRENAE